MKALCIGGPLDAKFAESGDHPEYEVKQLLERVVLVWPGTEFEAMLLAGYRNIQSTYLPGQRVGEWTLLEYRPGAYATRGNKRVRPSWHCQCSCGQLRLVASSNLQSGSSKGCGHSTKPVEPVVPVAPVNSVFSWRP